MSDGSSNGNPRPTRPTGVKIVTGPTPKLAGFFNVDEYEVMHERFDGTASPTLRRLVFDRGHAVAALLYDPDEGKVILVEQFRLPTYGRLPRQKDNTIGTAGSGWILETAAGMIKPSETPLECLAREVKEETGYSVKDAVEIATFYPSPGGSTERIQLFLAEVSRTDRDDKGDHRSDGDEDIRVHHLDQLEFIRRLENGELEDGKLIIAAYFLKDRLARSDRVVPKGQAVPSKYRLKATADLIVGVCPGDMLEWRSIDVWVNSENTEMEMDRLSARTVSGTIRYAGALKELGTNRVKEDVIADALRRLRGRHGYVGIGTVLETPPGDLGRTNGVKTILHVATVLGGIGRSGLAFSGESLETCVQNVLDRIDELNARQRYESALLPMMGAGQGGGRIEEIAARIAGRAVAYLERKHEAETKHGKAKGGLRQIYLSAYSERVRLALHDVLDKTFAEKLERVPGGA